MRSLGIALLLMVSAIAHAEETVSPVPPEVISKPPPKPPRKFLVYSSFAFNVYPYLGEKGTLPAANITPDKRAIIYQQIGFGYFVHPMVRLTLTLLFGETLTGVPPGTSQFSTLSIIPWV